MEVAEQKVAMWKCGLSFCWKRLIKIVCINVIIYLTIMLCHRKFEIQAWSLFRQLNCIHYGRFKMQYLGSHLDIFYMEFKVVIREKNSYLCWKWEFRKCLLLKIFSNYTFISHTSWIVQYCFSLASSDGCVLYTDS